MRPGIQPNSAASNRAPKTLGPLQSLPEHSTSLTSPLLPNTQSHLPGRGRQANLARGRSRSSIIKHESPTHPAPSRRATLRPGAPSWDHLPPTPAQPEPFGLEGGGGWAADALRTWGGPWSTLTGDTQPGPGAGARVEQWARCGAGARPGRAEGRSRRDGESGIRDRGALTVGFSGQLLHNFRLQLAVGFPHARRPRPPLPGPDPLGAPSGSGWVGPGCAEARRPGWAGPGPRLCLAVPARPVRGAPARCATAADGSRGLGDPARARPLRCKRPRRGVARGWAPQLPGLGSRGRPWLLGCVAHARYRCAAAAPTLPASRPHRRARGGLGAATQRPAPPPAQLRQARAPS